MARFEFRLDKVLEYRRLQEEWAKDAYLEFRARRLETEAHILAIADRRQSTLRSHPNNIDELRSVESYLLRLDDEEHEQRAILAIQHEEEENAQMQWIQRKRAADAIENLKEASLAEWDREQLRAEQAALDEWTTSRRKAA